MVAPLPASQGPFDGQIPVVVCRDPPARFSPFSAQPDLYDSYPLDKWAGGRVSRLADRLPFGSIS